MDLRRLYNKLMQKTDNNKSNIVDTILGKIKNNYKEYAFKHDGCRILQGCIKYGNKQQRKNIISEIKDTIYDLATGKYSIYLAIKLWKYAEKEEQNAISKICINKLTNLCKSASGEMFLNFVYLNSTKTIQDNLVSFYMKYKLQLNKEEVIRIFEENKSLENKAMEIEENYNAENKTEETNTNSNQMLVDDEVNNTNEITTESAILVGKKETYQHEDFNETFKKSLEFILEKKMHGNYIFHAALSSIFEYLSLSTKHYISELFDDDFEVFLNSKPSIELAMKIYTVASTKTRKKILKKVFKDDWANSLLASDFNITLATKILLTTDDTKLSTKQVLKPLIAYSNSTDFNVLVKVVHGIINPSKVHQLLEYTLDISTKKDHDKILYEILSICKKHIINSINVNAEKFLLDPEKKGLSTFLLDLISYLKATEGTVTNTNSNDNKDNEEESDDEEKDDSSFLEKVLEAIMSYLNFNFEDSKTPLILDSKNYLIIAQIIKRLKNSNNSNSNTNARKNSTVSNKSNKSEKGTKYCKSIVKFIEGIVSFIKTNIDKFLESKAIFIVLAIYEDSAFKKLLNNELKEKIGKLEKIKSDNNLNEKSAVSILLSHLKGKN